MTSAQESLKAALTSFLEDAVTAQDPAWGSGTLIEPGPGAEAFAARLAALPSAKAVDHAAAEAAKENGSDARGRRPGRTPPRWPAIVG